MLKWEFDFGPVRFAVSAFPPAGVVGEAVGCTRWTQGRLGLGADMRDESAWGRGQARVRGEEVGGVSVAARARARVPQHSERGAGERTAQRRRGPCRGDGDTWQAGKEVCAGGERGDCVADTLK